jgi:hypothetical protein
MLVMSNVKKTLLDVTYSCRDLTVQNQAWILNFGFGIDQHTLNVKLKSRQITDAIIDFVTLPHLFN